MYTQGLDIDKNDASVPIETDEGATERTISSVHRCRREDRAERLDAPTPTARR